MGVCKKEEEKKQVGNERDARFLLHPRGNPLLTLFFVEAGAASLKRLVQQLSRTRWVTGCDHLQPCQ